MCITALELTAWLLIVRAADGRASYIVYKNEKTAGITLIIIVALMTCIFSTLDNAVTLVHAEGSVDIDKHQELSLL